MTAVPRPAPCAGNYRSMVKLFSEYVPESVARGIISHALTRLGLSDSVLEGSRPPPHLLEAINRGLDLFLDKPAARIECRQRLNALIGNHHGAAASPARAFIPITGENEVVAARNRARFLADDLGFSRTDQIKIATAVSELARNIFRYAGSGSITLEPLSAPRRGLRIIALDQGPGISNLDLILSGGYHSRTGLGLGILGCKKLMDEFNIDTGTGRGTRVTLAKWL